MPQQQENLLKTKFFNLPWLMWCLKLLVSHQKNHEYIKKNFSSMRTVLLTLDNRLQRRLETLKKQSLKTTNLDLGKASVKGLSITVQY